MTTRSIKLLYFCSNEWGNLGRRKTRLAYEFAHQDSLASILYVNPSVDTSFLDLAKGRFLPSHLGTDRRAHTNAVLGRSQPVEERLWVYTGSTKTIPLTRNERLRRSPLLNLLNRRLYLAGLRRQLRRLPGERLVVWLSHPLQISALADFPERCLSCYDWTDDWLQYANLPVADRAELEQVSQQILRQTDVIFAVSKSLYDRARAVNPRTYHMPNATDLEKMAQSLDTNLPETEELQAIPKPRLGYIGQIGENIDYDMVRAIAQAHPAWSLVFVGPIWANKEAEVADLSLLPNVRFLGGRPHGQLPGFLRGFDVCLMPHLRNPLTISMDPTKLYDYLASGKPIVSTTIAGVERFPDSLYLGDTSAEFVAGVEAALRENGGKTQLRLEQARQNSWPERAVEMWAIVQQLALAH